jgi:serine/threonine-protein kinase RsbW
MENSVKRNEGWFELKIDSDLKNLELVADFITKTMCESGVQNEKDIFDVQLAVDEALTNIIEHAYAGINCGKITVQSRLSESKKEFIVKLKDSGKPFDPQTVASPDTDAKLEERKVGGLGIYFMKQLMQTVKYAINDKENELTMAKILS